MEAVIGCILGKLSDCTCNVAARHFADYSSSVTNLKAKLAELESVKGTLQSRVDQAILNGHVIKGEVRNFLSEAAHISEKATTFLQSDCQTADVKCSIASFPNIKSRRQLSKRAKEMIIELSRAVKDVAGDDFRAVISRSALQSCIADRDGFEDFGTRELILKEVMAALSSYEVTKIGLCGMGGVGKTMLAKEVARKVAEKYMFNEVVFVTLSQTPDLIAIQQSVAEKIRLDFGGIQSKAERADRLKRRLKEEMKILVVLDDIWDALDLREVGLNFEHDQRGCKILMTSRNLNVTRAMGAEKNILVEDLDLNEATALFTTVVGKNTVEHSDFKILAIEMVVECQGLPLAIKTIASALKDKELDDWKDALLQLRNSAPNNIDGMLTHVYPGIKLSFEYLKSKEAKKLLLLCSLYEEDQNIDVEELTMLCVGWGLFQDVHSIGDARRRVRSLLGTLKDRCLLLNGLDNDHVRMHDVTRDVAMFIATEDRWDMHSIRIDDRLEDKLHKNSLKEAEAIFLHGYHNNCNSFPQTNLECPGLELFVLSSYTTRPYERFRIGKKFFLECLNLKALSLLKADLSSIRLHQNLVTLCLQNCILDNIIDYIGDLRNLIVLDLRRSNVWKLPSNIGQLTHLQVLNLEGCYSLTEIKANVISRLTELEELNLPSSFQNWEAGEVGAETRNANVAELMNLHKLTTLSLSIKDAKVLPKVFLLSQKLEIYDIRIGEIRGLKLQFSKVLSITDVKASDLGSLMKSSECLRLTGYVGDLKNNALSDMDRQGFPELKAIEIDGCDEIRYIIDDTEQKSNVNIFSSVFVRLENMTLCLLRNLEKIFNGKLRANSFGQLNEVTVEDCWRLKNLFPITIARRLLKITVKSCKLMEEIVTFDGETVDASKVPFHSELRTLRLESLPILVRFISQPLSSNTSSVATSTSPLFNDQVVLPKLERLTLRRIDVKNIWANKLPSTSNNCTQNSTLEYLCIEECDNLKYLSSISYKPTTLNLLKVEKCRSLELIFVNQGGDEEGTSTMEALSFPHLEDLELTDLPNLRTFCATTNKQVVPPGEPEPLFNDTVSLPKLQSLTLSKIYIQKLWADKLLSTFKNCMQNSILDSLFIEECDNLKYLSSISDKPTTLRMLTVENCRSLELIFFHQGGDKEGTLSLETLSFPHLWTLKLIDLPKLKKFCATINELVMKFGKQEPLFNREVTFPNLDSLTLSKLDVEKIWTDELLSTSNNCMKNSILESLDVEECVNLKYLSTISDKPTTLKKLQVNNCRSLKVIFILNNYQSGDEEGASSSPEEFLYPNLERLVLSDLPNLKKFDNKVLQCGEQEPLFDKMVFPTLENLILSGLNIECLFPDYDHRILPTSSLVNMGNLQYLKVSKCNKLKHIFSSTMAKRLVKLERLIVSDCCMMEDIVARKEDQHTVVSEAILFPRLFSFTLTNLPALESLWLGFDERARFPNSITQRIIHKCPRLKALSDENQ